MYIRMLVLLCISLYTVRIILKILGFNDYGTYNIVAGILVFFTFINNGLASATKRYITTEIAKNDEGQAIHIFNTCLIAHVIISIVIILLSETIGLWVINNILNIPDNRLIAANWVYQFSLIAVIINILRSPYEAVIIAHEKMNAYALFSIADAIFSLLIVYLLQITSGDKLIIYSCLLVGSSLIIACIYIAYCFRQFSICKWRYTRDKELLKEIFNFMSWSLLGQFAVVCTNQGVNILINTYYSVVVNAAIGISNQVVNLANRFVSNFQVAFNPQIIKLYAKQENDSLLKLLYISSKISSFLIILFFVPISHELSYILDWWLGKYPPYTIIFCLLTFIAIYIEAISAPLWMIIYSQSNIKRYQIVISSVYILNFIFGWIVLALGFPPYYVILVRILIFCTLLSIRITFAKRLLTIINIPHWIWEIPIRGILIACIAYVLTYFCKSLLSNENSDILHIISTCILSGILTIILITCIGLNRSERNLFIKILIKKIKS